MKIGIAPNFNGGESVEEEFVMDKDSVKALQSLLKTYKVPTINGFSEVIGNLKSLARSYRAKCQALEKEVDDLKAK